MKGGAYFMPADNVTRPKPYICLKSEMKPHKCITEHKHTNTHDIVPLPERYIRVVVKIYGPFFDPCYNTAPNTEGTQRGTIILTITHL